MNLDRVLPLFSPLLRRALASRQAARRAQFNALPPAPGRVVFLGDSITEWTAWEDWFPNLPTVNRGIGGEAIGDVLQRLPSALVAPRAISLLIGTNDLHGLGKSTDVDEIAQQMQTLVGAIQRIAPSAPLFITSVLPRSTHFRDRLTALNGHYRRITAGSSATYVDMWPVLAGHRGAIRSEFTVDGLHLSIAGYAAWVEVLRPHLDRFVE
uniref:GDSL-type esterase/lipase family protein n=1 Tax=uncultured Sphingomonas sp. TaxID=158754 RepID=UPI0035CAB86D